MEYNDFQILSEQAYQTIREKFSHVKPDRKTNSSKLYFELADCLQICCNLTHDYNFKILTEISSLKKLIVDTMENLRANFNFSNIPSHSNINSNIFRLLLKIQNCLNICYSWQKNEEKEYYKNLINSIFEQLIKINSHLILSLETSNIKFFKYM